MVAQSLLPMCEVSHDFLLKMNFKFATNVDLRKCIKRKWLILLQVCTKLWATIYYKKHGLLSGLNYGLSCKLMAKLNCKTNYRKQMLSFNRKCLQEQALLQDFR